MKAAETEIDWTCASDDSGLAEACRAAASIAMQFETARAPNRLRRFSFDALFRRLYAAPRTGARA